MGRKPHYTSETTCNIYTTISHIVWKRSFQLLVFLGQSANETLVEQFVLHSTYTTRFGPQRRYSSSLGQTSPTSFQGAVVANKRRTSLSLSLSHLQLSLCTIKTPQTSNNLNDFINLIMLRWCQYTCTSTYHVSGICCNMIHSIHF